MTLAETASALADADALSAGLSRHLDVCRCALDSQACVPADGRARPLAGISCGTPIILLHCFYDRPATLPAGGSDAGAPELAAR